MSGCIKHELYLWCIVTHKLYYLRDAMVVLWSYVCPSQASELAKRIELVFSREAAVLSSYTVFERMSDNSKNKGISI